MASKILEKIFERNIEQFVGHFSDDSSIIYKNEKSKLIHPGEYGKYKEESCKQILRLILNKSLCLSDGFVITADDQITTQCDVIIYNSSISPIIADDISKMFPAEEVVAIVEIKSTLSRREYIKALRKMAANKQLILNGRKGEKHCKPGRTAMHYNTIGSFLICSKLDFDYDSLSYEEIYGDIDRLYWHNSILSIEDGVYNYLVNFNNFPDEVKRIFKDKGVDTTLTPIWEYSTFYFNGKRICTESNHCLLDPADKYKHIKKFIVDVGVCCDDVCRYTYDPVEYLGMAIKSIFKS